MGFDKKAYNREYSRKWYQDHREHVLAYQKKYRQENPDKVKLYLKEYTQKYRERDRAKANERAKKHRRNRCLTSTFEGKQITYNGLNKRPHLGFCELCGKAYNRKGKLIKLGYHHWDDKNLSIGLWACSRCHNFMEAVDSGISIKKYLLLKEQAKNEYKQSNSLIKTNSN